MSDSNTKKLEWWFAITIVVVVALTMVQLHATHDPRDLDEDGVNDLVDNCPRVANEDQYDYDKDGVGDDCDNCDRFYNSTQVDLDQDGWGAACDSSDYHFNAGASGESDLGDFDGDKLMNAIDNCWRDYNPPKESIDPNRPDPLMQIDSDHDGLGDVCDLD